MSDRFISYDELERSHDLALEQVRVAEDKANELRDEVFSLLEKLSLTETERDLATQSARRFRVMLYRRLRALGEKWNKPGVQARDCVMEIVDVYDKLCTMAEDDGEP